MNRILCGDVLETLKTLEPESVHSCITSPPYYGLRDYQAAGQIGLESSPGEYVQNLVAVFREMRRVLRSDGTFWLNIGDSYAGSGKAWSRAARDRLNTKQSYHYFSGDPTAAIPKTWAGIKPKDMIGIPWMLVFALRDDGWYLRSDIIWHKPNAMPESVRDRPTQSYEHLFLLSKSSKYYFDSEAIKEPVASGTVERMLRAVSANIKYAEGSPGQTKQTINKPRPRRNREDVSIPVTRNKRDVWTITTKPYHGAHFAAYPVELVTPCILAGCPEGGVVLDPFFGSGTTGAAAIKLGRRYIGIDINPAYCQLADERIREAEGGVALWQLIL